MQLELMKELLTMNNLFVDEEMRKVYFVSGHRNITDKEFKENYAGALLEAAYEERSTFVIGDYYGVDIMAQNYLVDVLKINPDRITVFHMFDSPRNINPKITKTKGGFKTDSERDAAMTECSNEDIAFVRDEKKMSGTGENILRRHKLKSNQ